MEDDDFDALVDMCLEGLAEWRQRLNALHPSLRPDPALDDCLTIDSDIGANVTQP